MWQLAFHELYIKRQLKFNFLNIWIYIILICIVFCGFYIVFLLFLKIRVMANISAILLGKVVAHFMNYC
jgi:hypothetical protein